MLDIIDIIIIGGLAVLGGFFGWFADPLVPGNAAVSGFIGFVAGGVVGALIVMRRSG